MNNLEGLQNMPPEMAAQFNAMAHFGGWFIFGIFALIIWSLVWKGIALWKCGRHNQLGWFIALLILNTVGILEIIYILFFQADKNNSKDVSLNPEV